MTGVPCIPVSELDAIIVPPECRGQIILVAYAAHADGVVRRVANGSTSMVSWSLAPWEALEGEYEPWNREPVVAATKWRPINVQLLEAE